MLRVAWRPGLVGLCASRIEHLSTEDCEVLVFNGSGVTDDLDSLPSASWLLARNCSVSLSPHTGPALPTSAPARGFRETQRKSQCDEPVGCYVFRLQAEPWCLRCSGLERSSWAEDFGAQAFQRQPVKPAAETMGCSMIENKG